ncbi:MAG TPA: hypothetical protein DCL07_05080 [Cryomorphaceae bacterium]|jgi:hypothetical protein|nr:hypothetical protein [Cryomorphaceae bacterium]HAB31367.1 hypothetical protein [Cryomorphaceae bacterium]HAG49292.1 hypothetical protein [Cryomorphaceae bacterium]|tara:strand:- start:619 stop:1032 length:414 start_codon:yes stop_codon:yes gene_type:complete
MKKYLLLLFSVLSVASVAQTRLADGSWEDKDVALGMISESVRVDGRLTLCIAKEDQCIDNLTIGFTVRVFDAAGKEIWNSVWSGKTMEIQFSKPLPTAARIDILAAGDFVINRTTANRISTGNPLSLSLLLDETTSP